MLLRSSSVSVVIALLALLGVAGCSDVPSAEAPPDDVRTLEVDGPLYNTLDTLTAASHLVVLATPVSARQGDEVSPGDELRFREVTANVEKVVYSSTGWTGKQVIILEEAWAGGEAISIQGRPWTALQQSAYFFLRSSASQPGAFIFVGSQGRIDSDSSGAVARVSRPKNSLTESTSGLTATGLEKAVTQAGDRVRRGELTAHPMGDPQ